MKTFVFARDTRREYFNVKARSEKAARALLARDAGKFYTGSRTLDTYESPFELKGIAMSQRKIGKHPALAAPYGVDLATRPDASAVQIRAGAVTVAECSPDRLTIDRDWINGLVASRKGSREALAQLFTGIGQRHGAEVEWNDSPATPGFSGQGIDLHFELNGVGAMVDVDNLFGGERTLISWHNTKHPARDFTARFCVCVGEHGNFRPHHKATSQPSDWYSLAMMLDAGLMLATRGQAFAPIE